MSTGALFFTVQKLIEQKTCETNEKRKNSAQTTDDIPAKIRALAELKEQGIISEEEFSSKESDLLAKM